MIFKYSLEMVFLFVCSFFFYNLSDAEETCTCHHSIDCKAFKVSKFPIHLRLVKDRKERSSRNLRCWRIKLLEKTQRERERYIYIYIYVFGPCYDCKWIDARGGESRVAKRKMEFRMLYICASYIYIDCSNYIHELRFISRYTSSKKEKRNLQRDRLNVQITTITLTSKHKKEFILV